MSGVYRCGRTRTETLTLLIGGPLHYRATIMPPIALSPEAISTALHAGRVREAQVAVQRLLTSRPNDPRSWISAAEVAMVRGCYGEMPGMIAKASKLGAPAPLCDYLRAHAEFGCGRVEQSIACAERAARMTSGAQRFEVDLILAEGLFLMQRIPELAAVLAANPPLQSDPRGQLLQARLDRLAGRSDAAESAMRAIVESAAPIMTRRSAGFELARLLDARGRFDEAFTTAERTHAATSLPFDTSGLVRDMERCASIAKRGGFRMRSAPTRRVEHTALLCSLPRSGTTLLEQMLDRHPGICGMGELPGVETIVEGITAAGGWPDGITLAETETLDRLQKEYIDFVRGYSNAPASVMTLDKTIHTWRRIPAITAVLPGAKLLRIKRDPRDNAISVYLANMHRETMGWNASMSDILRVIEAERAFVPVIAEALEVELLDIRYEDLVASPVTHLKRTLAFLGLPWDDACLTPESNRRTVITLSHEQVRRPVNRDSIGRWQNYGGRFAATDATRWATLGQA